MLKTSIVKYTDIKKHRKTGNKLCCLNIKTGCLPALFFILASSSPSYAVKPDNLQKYPIVHKVSNKIEFNVDNIIGVSGNNVNIRVNLPAVITRNSNSRIWLRIIGLPEELELSKGSKVSNIWFMSAKDIEGLVLKSPENFQGRFKVKFFLMRRDDSVVTIIGQTSASIDLKPVQETRIQPKQTTIVRKPTPKVETTVSSVPSEVELQTTRRARKFMKMGDIATARMLYENLALQGSARSAFAMGQTYDPEFLKKLLVRGLKPDVAKARTWYKKAIELSKKNGIDFSSGKPAFNVFQDKYSRHLGIGGRLTKTQREVFQDHYKLM